MVGPSNMPLRFPLQSWSSANAIGRTAFAISPTSIASASAISPVGWTRTSTTSGRVGSPSERRASTSERLLAGALLLRRERPFERGRGDGVEEVELPLGPAARRERVEPDRAARRERDRLDADRLREPVVLALDVDDPRLPAEDRLAKHVRLDEARLRAADDPDHDGVRARQLLAVELPRVVTERAAVDVAADVDAAAAEPALGDERVRGLDVRGRRAVPGLALRASPQPPAERQRVGERLLLLAVEAEQLEPRHLRGVLDLGAVALELLERARGDGDVAGEADGGVPVGEFLLAAGDGFGLAPPPARSR